MIDFTCELPVKVQCADCDGELTAEFSPPTYGHNYSRLIVEPCENCLAEAANKEQS